MVRLVVAEHRDICQAFVNKGSVKYGKFGDLLGNLSFQEGLLYECVNLVISDKYFDLCHTAARDIKRNGIRYVFFFPNQCELEFITGIKFYVLFGFKLT